MENLVAISKIFWSGKRVLVTGHSGFKGSWLVIWLRLLGAKVSGISLPPVTDPSLFSLAKVEQACESYFCDIRDNTELSSLIKSENPEIVFHLAAQALVRTGYRKPVETFEVNVMGTTHVLNALRELEDARVAVMITTDKVYRNNEWFWPYREDDALGGHDPYSSSKAASEIVISSYRDAFLSEQGLAIASARAGNVIGGGDWSEDRLIPDAIRAWQVDEVLEIRNPMAIRPWQHVLEPLAGYLILAQQLWENPELKGAYNFGPDTSEIVTVQDVVELARLEYGKGKVKFGDDKGRVHEAGRLILENAKVRNTLNIKPMWDLLDAIKHTMVWYRAHHKGGNTRELCESQIAAYEALL